MDVALLGANGQLGTDLHRALHSHKIVPLTIDDFDVTARRVFEEMVDRQAFRLSSMAEPAESDLSLLLPEDVAAPAADSGAGTADSGELLSRLTAMVGLGAVAGAVLRRGGDERAARLVAAGVERRVEVGHLHALVRLGAHQVEVVAEQQPVHDG